MRSSPSMSVSLVHNATSHALGILDDPMHPQGGSTADYVRTSEDNGGPLPSRFSCFSTNSTPVTGFSHE